MKNSQYLKYALGEILLVMVGILLAVQINNWNQVRQNQKREVSLLENLKEDLKQNILSLQNLDSIYAVRETNMIKAVELYTHYPKASDIKKIDSLAQTLYTTFRVNRSTYDEMLNDGIFYNLQNNELRRQIDQLYIEADNEKEAFIEINREIFAIYRSEDLNPYKGLLVDLENPDLDLSIKDTMWIRNHDSKTFLAGLTYLISTQTNSNTVRRRIIARHIMRCEALIKSIQSELDNR